MPTWRKSVFMTQKMVFIKIDVIMVIYVQKLTRVPIFSRWSPRATGESGRWMVPKLAALNFSNWKKNWCLRRTVSKIFTKWHLPWSMFRVPCSEAVKVLENSRTLLRSMLSAQQSFLWSFEPQSREHGACSEEKLSLWSFEPQSTEHGACSEGKLSLWSFAPWSTEHGAWSEVKPSLWSNYFTRTRPINQ